MNHVLIISSLSERYYYDAFIKECEKLGMEVGILDPEHFISENHVLDIRLDTAYPYGRIEVVKLGQDSNTTVLMDISIIKVAWYLRVNRTLRVSEIKESEKRFKWSEALSSLNSMLSVLPCKWINTLDSIEQINCNKLLQQMRAAQVGLKTPITVMSNSHKTIMDFCSDNGGKLLLKSIGYTNIDPDDEMVIYSEMFGLQELREAKNSIRYCPVYAQEYIQKCYEYRVMVIGGEIYACRIDSQASKKTSIDWRHYDFDNVAHIRYELPTEVSEKLFAFMQSVGLSYGAIDMIETPNGDFVFLEVNPSGQWDWISKFADLPIAKSVAYMLKSYMS